MTPEQTERYLSRSRRLQTRNVLRPMTGGELLDEALALYRRAAAGLLIPLALPVLVMSLAQAFVMNYVLVRFFETQNSDSLKGQMTEFVTNAALGLFVAAPIWIIALSYASALTVRRVSWALLGRPSNPSEATRDARRVLPSLIWAAGTITLLSIAGFLLSGAFMLVGAWLSSVTSDSSVVAGLVAGIGVLGLFVGFFWFLFVAGRYGLAAPTAVIEGVRGRALMKRVAELVKGQGRRSGASGSVISLAITSAVLQLLIAGSLMTISELLQLSQRLREGFGGLFGEALSGAVEMLPEYLSLLLVLPFFTIAITVLYFERRVRVEGYDISALAADIAPDRRSDGVRASG